MPHKSNDMPIAEAIQLMLKRYQLADRVQMADLQNSWEKLFGKTMAKYSKPVFLKDGELKIIVSQAPLKQQMHYNQDKLINIINDYFKLIVVKKVVLI
ncbi:MAG: hypothetical protein RIQ33_466 [Bacteroidota bacterium]|jgi:hypothetical protein